MRNGVAILHGQRRKVAFQLLESLAGARCSGVLVVDGADFFAPGDVFTLETDRGAAREVVVDKIRPEHEDALVAFSAPGQRA